MRTGSGPLALHGTYLSGLYVHNQLPPELIVPWSLAGSVDPRSSSFMSVLNLAS